MWVVFRYSPQSSHLTFLNNLTNAKIFLIFMLGIYSLFVFETSDSDCSFGANFGSRLGGDFGSSFGNRALLVASVVADLGSELGWAVACCEEL